VRFIHRAPFRSDMGLKKTSSLVNIGAHVTESAANTYTEQEVTLPLSSLDREVFVVTDAWIETFDPDGIAGTNSSVLAQIVKTTQGGQIHINNPTTIGRYEITSWSLGIEGSLSAKDFPQPAGTTGSSRDFLAIIATPNFFLGVEGVANAVAKQAFCRVQGYRATATADVFAALVTEEINS